MAVCVRKENTREEERGRERKREREREREREEGRKKGKKTTNLQSIQFVLKTPLCSIGNIGTPKWYLTECCLNAVLVVAVFLVSSC
jgi:hypothetical protein